MENVTELSKDYMLAVEVYMETVDDMAQEDRNDYEVMLVNMENKLRTMGVEL